jgi:hypothetical protein
MAAPSHQSVWEARAAGLAVCLTGETLAEVERLVMHGFKAVPKRGLEVGGLLFGRTESGNGLTSVRVTRVAAIACEYRFGPSLLLSDSDYSRLREQLRPAGDEEELVGFFRSHTRSPFQATSNDAEFLRLYVPVSGVFLLIKPVEVGESLAKAIRLFDGELGPDSGEEFAFGWRYRKPVEDLPAPKLVPKSPPVRVAEPQPPPPEPVAFVPAPPLMTKPRRRFRGAAAAIAALGAIGAVSYWAGRISSQSVPPAAARPQSASSPAALPPRLGLAVERIRDQVRITWNAAHPDVAQAELAFLRIRDSGIETEMPLSAADRRRGNAMYAPKSSDLNIEFQVVSGGLRTSEYARLVMATPPSAEREAPIGATALEAEIREFLDSWRESLLRGQVSAFAAHYAPVVQNYFTQEQVSRAAVERQVRRILSDHGRFQALEITPLSISAVSRGRTVATIRKRWKTVGPRVFAGDEQERLSLLRNRGRWLITSHTETRLSWVQR